MKKTLLYLTLFLITGLPNFTKAQIISIAPGTEFSVAAGTTFSTERLEFHMFGHYSITNNTLNVNFEPITIKGISSIQRVYKFSNPLGFLLGSMVLNYQPQELNGLQESDLKLLYNDGTSWKDDKNSITNLSTKSLRGGILNSTRIDAFSAGKLEATGDLIIIRAYPNPTSSEFNVMVMTKGIEDVELVLMDVSGHMLQKLIVRPYETKRIGGGLSSGNYVLHAMQGNRLISATKIIKQ